MNEACAIPEEFEMFLGHGDSMTGDCGNTGGFGKLRTGDVIFARRKDTLPVAGRLCRTGVAEPEGFLPA